MSKAQAAPFSWPVRVYFHDTDAGGIVFHGNYLHFMEASRTEYFQALGYNVAELQQQGEVLFVVHKLELNYYKPARLHDQLRITASIDSMGGARLVFDQQTLRGEELLVRAKVHLATVDPRSLKPIPVPEGVRKRVEAFDANNSKQGGLQP